MYTGKESRKSELSDTYCLPILYTKYSAGLSIRSCLHVMIMYARILCAVMYSVHKHYTLYKYQFNISILRVSLSCTFIKTNAVLDNCTYTYSNTAVYLHLQGI